MPFGAPAGASPISPSDPSVIIAGIRRFGLAADGSDLRDLEAAFERNIVNMLAMMDDKKVMRSEADALRATVERLRTALVPFVTMTRALDLSLPDDHEIFSAMFKGRTARLRLRDFRAALAAGEKQA